MKFADLLFPPKCILCDEPTRIGKPPLCPECAVDFSELIAKRCSKCGMDMCECECYPVKDVDKKYFLMWYKDITSKRIIYSIKRAADVRHIDFLSELLALRIRQYGKTGMSNDLGFSCICNVPRSEKAIKQYGYDQSKLIAENLSKALGVPYICLLKRSGKAEEQKTLSGALRTKNTKGIFTLSDNASELKGKIGKKGVLIADDVTTSGATLSECAAVLRSFGFKTAEAAIIAQTPNTNITIQNRADDK